MAKTDSNETLETELHINAKGGQPVVIKGNLGQLHNDPAKIHKLLDLLEMPAGTEVQVITRGASVIVR